MLDIIVLYFLIAIIFLAIDLVWLGFIGKNFYNAQIGFLLKENPNWPAAALFYGLYVIGVVVFVAAPALSADSAFYALGYGALFGLITYATYDMTNLATLKDWPLKITVVDLIWGSTLVGFSSFLAVLIHQLIF